jgi:predicted Rossmann-fold nucleotide-binding protein
LAAAYLKQQRGRKKKKKKMDKIRLNIIKEPPDKKHYAAIGTRAVPDGWQNLCRKIGVYLAKRDWVLHTGAAQGADQLYAEGALRAGGSIVLHLPWETFERDWWETMQEEHPRRVEIDVLDTNDTIARQSVVLHHPNPEKLTNGGRLLHARNYRIVKDTSFVIAFPKNGQGGTMQGIRVAEAAKLPVIRLDQVPPKEAQRQVDELIAAAVKP